ncbi:MULTISPECIES: phage/plasmid primase, P4 family [Protofrankia]|uniref:DNA primase family protein n=1 Tax=Protofrankia TaxID=2994361 RepID=UPI0009757947|nr:MULTISPECIES: phage/plasmid primase, P4 family [Protofrankia]ONH34012.1 hypothetical protein BL254_18400 [Protofrankia sp. BMG5.30]
MNDDGMLHDLGSGDIEPDDDADGYVPPPNKPMTVARHLMARAERDGLYTLRHWRGTWMRWELTHWREIDDREIRADAYKRLEHAQFAVRVSVRVKAADGTETTRVETRGADWIPTKRKIAELLESMAAITHLPSTIDPPSWIGPAEPGEPGKPGKPGKYQLNAQGGRDPIVACSNGLLRLADRTVASPTPAFFNLVSVPFAYSPDAPKPERWLAFLGQLWPDDPDAIATLQEFFGYVVSGRTDLHKILLIVGPTRSGKGTIGRILTALVGKGNMAGPTLASMGSQFGLSPLLGKPLAIISDARLNPRDGQQVVERLLTISGEDTIDIDRKHKDPWTGRLPARIVILSNELPKFGDASGVIAYRFLVLAMRHSWLGQENPGLSGELLTELPGILNWALDGLDRLTAQGRFTEPASSVDAVLTMKDMASPMSAFVRECCDIGPRHEIAVDVLWKAWRAWCDDSGNSAGTKATFGRNLQSIAPQMRRTKPRGPDGKQVPTYSGITLKSDVGPAMQNYPAHPAQPAQPDVRSLTEPGNEPAEPGEPGTLPLQAVHESALPAELADVPPDEIGDCAARCGRKIRRYGPHATGTLCPACLAVRRGGAA